MHEQCGGRVQDPETVEDIDNTSIEISNLKVWSRIEDIGMFVRYSGNYMPF